MTVILILGSVALVGIALAGGLLVVIIGIHRSDRCKRMTGRSGSLSETLTQHLLVGSRDYDSPHDAGEDR